MTKENYFKCMHLKNRCIVFADDEQKIRAMATFVITDDPTSIRRSGLWGLPEENPQGKFILVDRLITDRNSSLRNGMIDMLNYFKKKYPDKKVVWKSRKKGEVKYALST